VPRRALRTAAPHLLPRHGERTFPSSSVLYCQASKATDNKEQCDLLTRIQCDIRRLHSQKIVELADSMADKGQDGALEKYKEGGDAYSTCGAPTASSSSAT